MSRQKFIGKVVDIQKKWLSAAEAKAYLGCSDDFLRKLRDEALVSFSQFGRNMYWYELNSLEKFILKHKVI